LTSRRVPHPAESNVGLEVARLQGSAWSFNAWQGSSPGRSGSSSAPLVRTVATGGLLASSWAALVTSTTAEVPVPCTSEGGDQRGVRRWRIVTGSSKLIVADRAWRGPGRTSATATTGCDGLMARAARRSSSTTSPLPKADDITVGQVTCACATVPFSGRRLPPGMMPEGVPPERDRLTADHLPLLHRLAITVGVGAAIRMFAVRVVGGWGWRGRGVGVLARRAAARSAPASRRRSGDGRQVPGRRQGVSGQRWNPNQAAPRCSRGTAARVRHRSAGYPPQAGRRAEILGPPGRYA
jgi:hypothetical protein